MGVSMRWSTGSTRLLTITAAVLDIESRRSEVLKMQNIDSDRTQVFIEESKSKKDGYVNLRVVLLAILRNYFKLSDSR